MRIRRSGGEQVADFSELSARPVHHFPIHPAALEKPLCRGRIDFLRPSAMLPRFRMFDLRGVWVRDCRGTTAELFFPSWYNTGPRSSRPIVHATAKGGSNTKEVPHVLYTKLNTRSEVVSIYLLAYITRPAEGEQSDG